MKRPITRCVGHEFHGLGRARRNVDCRHGDPRRGRHRAAVGAHVQEAMTVNVDRMAIHAHVAKAQSDALAGPDDERVGTWPDAGVEREQVEVEHHGRIRCRCEWRSMRGASRTRGWMTKKPIIPSAIWTISSECGWYICTPCCRSVNS